MARIRKRGGVGELSGKFGDMVVGTWNGIDVVRSTPRRSKQKATQSQLEQQQKMAIAGRFLGKIKKVVKLGFRDVAFGMSAYNVAAKDLINTAIQGQFPDYRIDYSLVGISKGYIFPQFAPTAVSTEKETITFTWDARALVNTQPTDRAILVAYNPDFNVAAYELSGPERTAGTGSVVIPGLSGKEVHTWMAFISADGKNLSDSRYAGKVTLV